jgi:hypothetical protein
MEHTSYTGLLDAAYALGLSDGCFAAAFEPADSFDALPSVCRGRDPEQFARLLWAGRPGAPPSGLEVNAPLWYARGFADGCAVARRDAVHGTGVAVGHPAGQPH